MYYKRPALGHTQPPVHWVLGAQSPVGKAADHSLPSSAKVKNA